MDNKVIAVFKTTHETIRSEELLEENSIDFKPVIKPRSMSSECGMALEINLADSKKLVTLCMEEELALVGLYKVKCGEFEKL